MDVLEQVGQEVKEVIWKTCSEQDRNKCRVPIGCEKVEIWDSQRPGVSGGRDAAESSQSQSDSDRIIWT